MATRYVRPSSCSADRAFYLNALFFFLRLVCKTLRLGGDAREYTRVAAEQFADCYDSWGEYTDEQAADPNCYGRTDLTKCLWDLYNREQDEREAIGRIREAYLQILDEENCSPLDELWKQAEAELR